MFGPQHGFRSDLQENMIESPHARDARAAACPSTRSTARRASRPRRCSAGLDALVIDLQDVGTRIYTYIYTMANCLRAARAHGLPVVVCDRPNPIGGVAVEGPMLEPGFESFVGQFPIPMRHGMTIGELARLFNEHFGIGAKLEVVAMQGWSRGMYFDDTGLPWVLPSPNIPTLDSGDRLSGHGAVRRHERLRRTRHDEAVRARRRALGRTAESFARALNALGLPGVHFRPALFEPTFHKHAEQRRAAAARFTSPTARRSGRSKPASRSSTRSARPDRDAFAWREPPYEYEHDEAADRHPVRIGRAARRPRARRDGARRSRPRGRADDGARSSNCARQFLLY